MNVNERYQIEKELGRGGIGIVYLARDTHLHAKPVVIKVLQQTVEESAHSEWFKKKFQQEVEALARINHPGIIGVLDSGEMADGRPFFVMQFIEGISLREAISEGQMAFARVAAIIRQMGSALSAAHEKGVWHRDLKPENIMLQRLSEDEEQVRVIDFGIATVKDSQVAASGSKTMVAGTPGYMAPEQLKGSPSAASDIYAMGAMVYEMLTGALPFEETSAVQLYEAQQKGVSIRPAQLRADLPEAAEQAILKALAFAPEARHQRARDFSDELAKALTAPEEKTSSAENDSQNDTETSALRLVLLYKRDTQPDKDLLTFLETHFRASGCRVFIDRHLSVGVEWARAIEREIRAADVVIPLLSASSVTSEMLAYEIQMAHAAAQQNGKPRLLPVRINDETPLPDPLAAILNPIQYALWNSMEDNERVANELLNACANNLPQPKPVVRQSLEPVGGAVPLTSEFYIVRPADEDFRAAITRQDSIVLVKGARQMGKTSLLARGLQQARSGGAKVVLTDFQKLNATHLESVDSFFLTLAEWIAEQLDIEAEPEQTWNPRRGASINFERYMRREILGKITTPLVWGLDEVDRLFTCSFGSEVFGLFRSWHNERSLDPEGPWNRLTMAIAYATEAHLFITDLNQSPFNVGTRLTLEDFTLEQVAELNRRYGSPLNRAGELASFYRLVGGQPYLVRRGLHEMSAQAMNLVGFEAVADRDEGPFGDHLRRILVLLAQDAELCEVVKGILKGRPCPNQESFYRLRSAGVMAGESASEVRPRCQLYATYLERHLL